MKKEEQNLKLGEGQNSKQQENKFQSEQRAKLKQGEDQVQPRVEPKFKARADNNLKKSNI